ncbi:MAG: EAL domain-containing response regulator [Pseudanabaenaceae cyanobacterium bins.39]|nr:EAL domain-containing response regulator [Pseudanabaenaceae cyanobacterium bins.39]
MNKNNVTILVVEDTLYNLKLLSAILTNQGYKVLEATNGREGLALANSHELSLILLDIKMPDMNGYEVCLHLKNNPNTQLIPIVFISATDNIEEKVEAFAIGGIDFINKPFHVVEVLARVETHLRVSSLQAQLLAQTKILESQNIRLQKELSNLVGVDWELYSRIKQGFENQEFQVFYQPIFNLRDDTVIGLEALIRWQHPEKGLLAPGEFIELVEATDLIYPVGKWVIDSACRQLHLWHKSFPSLAHLTMNVNVSTRQLTDFNLVSYVRAILSSYQINPRSLKLEITESTVMGDRDRTLQILDQLKALNIQFCIDDFGTGYSSLRRLTDFPIDILKIDRSFIHNAEWIIVRAIASLAFSLGKEVVIEGVETIEQVDKLRELFPDSIGRVYGQGYLFARPLSADATTEFLQNYAIAAID